VKRGLAWLTGPGHAEALARRGGIAALALEERNEAARKAGKAVLPDLASYVSDVAQRTVCLTLLAGSGSRWQRSLAASAALPAAERPAAYDPGFDPGLPRGLYPVRDFLGIAGPGGRLPVAAYSLAALKGFGRHLIVVRGHEEDIDRVILSPLGIAPSLRRFFEQETLRGKPLGHGDAAFQCREAWRGADFVVANFGGDANSRLSVLEALLAMDALREAGDEGRPCDLLLPAALVSEPGYPIGLDAGGLPRSFGHAKLQGGVAGGVASGASGGASGGAEGYTNVGLRVYRASALLEKVESFRRRFFADGEGYAIPGNDPEGHEFALDNVDGELAREGRARILASCRPAELCPAKALEDIPAFEAAVARVVEEDGRLGL
jgi:hypothetical protein